MNKYEHAWVRLLHDGEVVLKLNGEVRLGRILQLNLTQSHGSPVYSAVRLAGMSGPRIVTMQIEAEVVDEREEELAKALEAIAEAGPLTPPDPGLLTEVFAREGLDTLGPSVERTAVEIDAMPTEDE